MEAVNGLAVCAGIGGLELGLSLCLKEYCPVGWVEQRREAVAVLQRFSDAPVWDDLATFDGLPWREVVDILTAGWPCQPHSSASRGRRVHPDLWPDVFRVVCEVQPGAVFLENVPGPHWRDVRSDLQDAGYTVPEGALLEAAAVGAPHQRRRVFLLAHAYEEGECPLRLHDEVAGPPGAAGCIPGAWARPPTPGELERLADGLPAGVAHGLAGEAVVPAMAAAAFALLARRAVLVA